MKKLFIMLIGFFLLNAAILPTLECRSIRGRGYHRYHRSRGGDVAAGLATGLATGLVAGAVASSAKEEGPTRAEIEAKRAQDKIEQAQREQQRAEMEKLRLEMQQQKMQQQQQMQQQQMQRHMYQPRDEDNGFGFWIFWLALFAMLFIGLAFLIWAKQKKQGQA